MIGYKKGNVEAELRSVIERNLKGLQEENLELALRDIDDSLKENTRYKMMVRFKFYDLSYKLLSFKVISIKKDTADVEVVQETKKIKGLAFVTPCVNTESGALMYKYQEYPYQDNVATVVHTLKKRFDGWKIVDTKIKETKYL